MCTLLIFDSLGFMLGQVLDRSRWTQSLMTARQFSCAATTATTMTVSMSMTEAQVVAAWRALIDTNVMKDQKIRMENRNSVWDVVGEEEDRTALCLLLRRTKEIGATMRPKSWVALLEAAEDLAEVNLFMMIQVCVRITCFKK